MSNKLKRKTKDSFIAKVVNPDTSFIKKILEQPIEAIHPSALEKPYDIEVIELLIDFFNGDSFPLSTKTYSLTSTEILEGYPDSEFAMIASKFLETKKLSLRLSGRDILNDGEAVIPFIDFSVTQKMTREEFKALADELQNIVSTVLGVKADCSDIAEKTFHEDTFDYYFDGGQYYLRCTYNLDAEDTTKNLVSLTYKHNGQFLK